MTRCALACGHLDCLSESQLGPTAVLTAAAWDAGLSAAELARENRQDKWVDVAQAAEQWAASWRQSSHAAAQTTLGADGVPTVESTINPIGSTNAVPKKGLLSGPAGPSRAADLQLLHLP
eukprot:SAG31_NODE_5219_length_2669_cov_1.862646_2_plen_120_part_00